MENKSAMRVMVTHTVGEIIGKNDFFTDDQKKYLDLNLKIAFKHPKQKDILIFIGGDMPHIVKEMVMFLESKCKKT